MPDAMARRAASIRFGDDMVSERIHRKLDAARLPDYWKSWQPGDDIGTVGGIDPDSAPQRIQITWAGVRSGSRRAASVPS